MIQLVINTNMLREIDERRIIHSYARLFYESDDDITVDSVIKDNLINLLDWDKNGDKGLGIYCGKFEKIKRRDWKFLIDFIKSNGEEIRTIYGHYKNPKLKESLKEIKSIIEKKEEHNIARFTSENYKVSGRGKKAKPCTYEGRQYKSQQECLYKEGLTKFQLYNYLKKTNQI